MQLADWQKSLGCTSASTLHDSWFMDEVRVDGSTVYPDGTLNSYHTATRSDKTLEIVILPLGATSIWYSAGGKQIRNYILTGSFEVDGDLQFT